MSTPDGLPAIMIPPQGDGWLEFDLREVMTAVGDQSQLSWTVRDAEFVGDVEAETRSADGLSVTWAQLWQLGERVSQTIDADFEGAQDGRLRLWLQAFDSSYWLVASDRPEVLDAVRRVFRGVTDYLAGGS